MVQVMMHVALGGGFDHCVVLFPVELLTLVVIMLRRPSAHADLHPPIAKIERPLAPLIDKALCYWKELTGRRVTPAAPLVAQWQIAPASVLKVLLSENSPP